MNILFFLTPKEDVAHVDEDDTMRQQGADRHFRSYAADIVRREIHVEKECRTEAQRCEYKRHDRHDSHTDGSAGAGHMRRSGY